MSSSGVMYKHIKERLLPPTPIESVLEFLVELLPRRNVCASLAPIADITVLSEAQGEYQSTSDTPRFGVNFENGVRAGWYYVESALVRHNGSREAAIEVVTSTGASIIPIPTNLRGSVREVLRLPDDVIGLSWLPTAAPGFFSQTPLLIHRISAVESVFRRAYRVMFDLWRFRKWGAKARAGLTWAGLLTNLSDAYAHSASLRLQRLNGTDYASFIARNDRLSSADMRAMRSHIRKLPSRPIISLLMPLRGADSRLLRRSIESVVAQLYPNWELLLLHDEPDIRLDEEVIGLVGQDARIRRLVSNNSSGHGAAEKAAVLNAGLQASCGGLVVVIDPHDLLPIHALYCLAKEQCEFPNVQFIYSDDDEIGIDGVRLNPRFKPDWNPDLLYSYHYVGNLAAYRRDRLNAIGGFAVGYAGAEAYELDLRYLVEIPEAQIRHIPKVLYHRHTTAADPHPVANIHEAGKRALNRHFHGSAVKIDDGVAPGLYRIRYPLPEQRPLVSIIIPTRDRVDLLRRCIESIQQKTEYGNWELLVVDNQSSDIETLRYFDEIENDRRIRVIKYDNRFNYSAINNHAVRHANGDVLALVNNDVEVISRDWLSEMVGHAIRPGIGAVGSKLLYPDGRIQHAGVITGLGGVAGHVYRFFEDGSHGYCHRAVVVQNLSAVTAACLVVRKEVYWKAGGLDEDHFAVAFNDVDFCLNLLAAGYRNVFTPHVSLYHHESMSRGHDDTAEKRAIFLKECSFMMARWGSRLSNDPAYNPNLTREYESATYRCGVAQ